MVPTPSPQPSASRGGETREEGTSLEVAEGIQGSERRERGVELAAEAEDGREAAQAGWQGVSREDDSAVNGGIFLDAIEYVVPMNADEDEGDDDGDDDVVDDGDGDYPNHRRVRRRRQPRRRRSSASELSDDTAAVRESDEDSNNNNDDEGEQQEAGQAGLPLITEEAQQQLESSTNTSNEDLDDDEMIIIDNEETPLRGSGEMSSRRRRRRLNLPPRRRQRRSPDFEASDDEEEEDDDDDPETATAPADARQHTYLPGVSHPLYPEEWLQHARSWNSSSRSLFVKDPDDLFADGAHEVEEEKKEGINLLHAPGGATAGTRSNHQHQHQQRGPTITSLPVLEIENVILFPGSTIPLRLRDPHWVEYLQRRINQARDIRSWLSSSSRSLTGDRPEGEGVQIGILPKVQQDLPNNVVASIPNEEDTMFTSSDEDDVLPADTSANNNTDTVNSNSSASTDPNDAAAMAWLLQRSQQHEEERRERRLRRERERQQREQQRQQQQQQQQEEQQQRRQEQQQQHRQRRGRRPFDHSSAGQDDDDLTYRIGTIATITYTHEGRGIDEDGDSDENARGETDEDEDDEASRMLRMISDDDSLLTRTERRNRRRARQRQQHDRVRRRLVAARRETEGQLVLTALGTGRFQILSDADASSDGGDSRSRTPQQRRQQRYDRSDGVKIYKVEVLPNGEFSPLPKSSLLMSGAAVPQIRAAVGSAAVARSSGMNPGDFHNKMIQRVARVSSVPACAFRRLWPWRLVDLIRSDLEQTPSLAGLHRSLEVMFRSASDAVKEDAAAAEEGDDSGTSPATPTVNCDPLIFSFWMASNMALSDRERMDLLEMDCVVERLLFLQNKVNQLRQESRGKPLRCKRCAAEISRTNRLFTVGGADGTTGAYVNSHGVIHQTITLRSVDTGSVMCHSGAFTQDSWFPGYSWTITNCALCMAHLGWKFTIVRKHRSRAGRLRQLAAASGSDRTLRVGERDASSDLDDEDEDDINGDYGDGRRHAAQNQNNDNDRPDTFWGLSAASITTADPPTAAISRGGDTFMTPLGGSMSIGAWLEAMRPLGASE